MKRPELRKIALSEVLPLGKTSGIMATMSEDQWDTLLAALYNEGAVLLELDRREALVAAYQRPGAALPVPRAN